jgi:hypothetical protein
MATIATTATIATIARIHKGAHEEQDLSEPKVLFDPASDEPKAGIQETRRAGPRNDDDHRFGREQQWMFANRASANRRHRRACLGRTEGKRKEGGNDGLSEPKASRLFGRVDHLSVKNIRCRRVGIPKKVSGAYTQKGMWRIYYGIGL